MQRDGEPVGGARLQDRPVAAPPERLQATRRDLHLHKALVACPPLDLGDRRLAVLQRDLHRALQPRLAVGPGGGLPVIDGGAHGGTKLDVPLIGAAAHQRQHHPVTGAKCVQQLRAQEIQIGARDIPVRWPRIQPHAHLRRHARIVGGVRQRLPRPSAEHRLVLAPALRQERIQLRARCRINMHVAIDVTEQGLCRSVGAAIEDGDVHRLTPSNARRFRADCRTASCGRAIPANHPARRLSHHSASAGSRLRTETCPRSRFPR